MGKPLKQRRQQNMSMAEQIITDYKEAEKEKKRLESRGIYVPTELLKKIASLGLEILDNNLSGYLKI
jgi:lipoate-protein ligase B